MIAGSHIQGRKVAQIVETLLEIKTSRPNAGDVVEAQIWYNSAAGQKRIEFKDNSVIVTVPRLDYDETISGNWTINTGAVEPPIILHANNQGTSTSVRVTGLHADILDTYHADTAATASTIAARDSNGRIKAADPSASDDLVPYGFLQGYVAGIRDPKDACEVATTANLAATRTSNTLTASANGSINTAGIDGITDLAVNDRVLVKNQTTGADNGLFIVSDLGSASTPWVLQRSSDADSSGEMTNGVQVWVTRGSDNGGTGWLLNTQDPITLNTTALTFIQINGTADIQQGKGIVIVGNTIHAIQSTDYTTNALIYASSTTALAMSANLTWNGSVLDTNGRGRFQSSGSDPASGVGVEILYDTVSSFGHILAFDRAGAAWKQLRINSGGGNVLIRTATDTGAGVSIGTGLTFVGAQTIQTSTGNLTLATAAGNGNIVATPHGTGITQINSSVFIARNQGGNRYLSLDNDGTNTGTLVVQAGGGSDAYGGSVVAFGHAHATRPGWITANISTGSAGQFAVTNTGLGTGTALFSVNTAGLATATNVTITALTQKSVLFAGASGAVSQDNSNFQYSSTDVSLGVGRASSTGITIATTRSGAKTEESVAIFALNTSTSSTASLVKTGVSINVNGTWNGSGAKACGILIEAVSGGTANWAIDNQSGANVYLGTGNVGIGVTPSQLLHIQKNQDAGTYLRIDNNSAGTSAVAGMLISNDGGTSYGNLFVGGTGYTGAASWQDSFVLSSDTGLSGGVKIRAGAGGIKLSASAAEANDFFVATTGRIGIATTSPSFDLSFGGNAARTMALERHTTADTAGSSFTITAGGCTSGATDKSGGILHLRGGQNTGSGVSTIQFWTCAVGGTSTTDGTQTLRGSINNAGLWTITANLTVDTTINATTGYKVNNLAASGTILRGNGTNYVASTATFPDGAATNDLLYASGSNTWATRTSVASRVLVTNGSGVPDWALDLPVGITIGGKDAALIVDGTVTGDGAATTLTYTHSLNRKARIVGVRKQSDDQLVLVDWKPTASFTTTKVDLTFAAAPANGEVFEVSVAA